jgi:hypothetical protein
MGFACAKHQYLRFLDLAAKAYAMNANHKWKVWLFAGILVTIAVIINGSRSAFFLAASSPSQSNSRDNEQTDDSDPSQVKTGIIFLTTELQGVTCVGESRRLVGKMLTDNAWWQARLDRDDSRIFTLQPRNLAPSGHLEISNYNRMEWRIKPGQAISRGKLVWTIGPNKSN